jgi:competence protein ComEA
MKVRIFTAVALVGLAIPALTPAWADDYKSLPDGPGRDVTVRVCAQCHSPEIAAQQKLDAQGWKDLVNQMANNGANATDAEFDTISKYLATSFPAK